MTQAIIQLRPHGLEYAGMIPMFLNPENPEKAAVQLDFHYQHGGGWQPMEGWTSVGDSGWTIQYPGDEPLEPYVLIEVPLTGEFVLVYDYGFVAVFQAGSRDFEVARMD